MAGLTYREQIAGFPARQMVVVSLIRFSEPIAFTSLFPYLYFMIRDFKIAPTEKEISKYSGYLASSFAFFQFLFAVQWGKLSDRVGRKPVLLFGLMGTSLTLLLFGFSTNYYTALFARSISGVLNGNIAVLRTVVGEICVERRHQAIGFSTLPLFYNVGAVIGPLIGGSYWFTRPSPTNPYEKSAAVVDSIGNALDKFRSRHPYALSNIVVSVFLWFSILVGFLFLEETNEKFAHRRDYGIELGDSILALAGVKRPTRAWNKVSESDETSPLLESHAAIPVAQPVLDEETASDEALETLEAELDAEDEEIEAAPFMSSAMSNAVVRRCSQSSLISKKPAKALTPQVITVILSNCIISLHNVAFSEFLPVFLAARFQKDALHFPFTIVGGFGLDSSYIGTLFSSTGMMGMLIVLVIFPWIDRQLGTMEGYRLSLCFFPVVYTCVPLSIFTLHKYNEVFPSWGTPVLLYGLTSLRTLASATGLPQVMLLNHRAAAKEHRAFVNSLTMSMLALARCLGPIAFGYLMTLGDSYHIGWLSWWVMTLLALFGLVQSYFMKDYDD